MQHLGCSGNNLFKIQNKSFNLREGALQRCICHRSLWPISPFLAQKVSNFFIYVYSLIWPPLSFLFLTMLSFPLNFPSIEFNYLLEALNTSTASDEKIKHVEANNNDQARYKVTFILKFPSSN